MHTIYISDRGKPTVFLMPFTLPSLILHVLFLIQVMKDAGMAVEPWMMEAPRLSKQRRRQLAKKPIRRKPIIDGRARRKKAKVVTRDVDDDE